MVVPQGFEPQISGPKPDVLPLHQRTIYVGAIGLEPMNSNEGGFTVRSNCRYATLPICTPGWARTTDNWFWRPVLYQLNYRRVFEVGTGFEPV